MIVGHGDVLPAEKAALLHFEPTSVGSRWRGKFRCAHCKSTGYVTYELLVWPFWWGRTHGTNCKKRPR